MIKQRNFLLYILLTIVTCGLYNLFFWYSFTEDLNSMSSNDSEPLPNFLLVILLSIITCNIYQLFWYYKVGDKLHREGNARGLSISEGGSTVLLWMTLGAFLCGIGPFIGLFILIKNFNLLAENSGSYNNII